LALSAVVVLGWLALVVYTIVAAAGMEPGWSMAPSTRVLDTIFAYLVLAALWGLIFGLELTARLRRELRQQPH
jgi:hypothetical protein